MTISRRAVLIGGGATVVVAGVGGTALVNARVLPGKARLDEWRGACRVPVAVPTIEPGPVIDGSFGSSARRTQVGWSLFLPPGDRAPADLPVCVALHGRSADHRFAHDLAVDRFLAAAVAGGVPPFAVVSVDGGDAVNWHRRASGDDPVAMVVDELLPEMARRGHPTDRVALWGWSLGGWGALHLATQLGRERVAAVAAASPAIWRTFADIQPGAFDDAADFDRHDLFRRSGELSGIPLRIDCGDSDPFASGVADLRSALSSSGAAIDGGLSPGCHDSTFFQHVEPEELAFLGRHLAG